MLTPSLRLSRAQDLEQLLDDQRREAERGLVEQHQARPQHQRAADRQHLLLAARQRAGLLARAAPSGAGNSRRPARCRRRCRRGRAASSRRARRFSSTVCAREGAAALRHMGDAAAARCPRSPGRRSSVPSKRISPRVRTMPHSARSVVVLPAPLAPSSVVTPPSSTAKSSPNSTWSRRRRRTRPRASSSAAHVRVVPR